MSARWSQERMRGLAKHVSQPGSRSPQNQLQLRMFNQRKWRPPRAKDEGRVWLNSASPLNRQKYRGDHYEDRKTILVSCMAHFRRAAGAGGEGNPSTIEGSDEHSRQRRSHDRSGVPARKLSLRTS